MTLNDTFIYAIIVSVKEAKDLSLVFFIACIALRNDRE